MNITYENSIPVKEYNKLRELVGWGAFSEKQAKKGLENSAYIVAAKQEEHVVGTVRVIYDGGSVAFVVDVMVAPNYQGRGIGQCMVKRLMAYLKSCLDPGDMIFVGLMAAKGKEGFYEQFGFIDRPNDSMGPGMVMWLRE